MDVQCDDCGSKCTSDQTCGQVSYRYNSSPDQVARGKVLAKNKKCTISITTLEPTHLTMTECATQALDFPACAPGKGTFVYEVGSKSTACSCCLTEDQIDEGGATLYQAHAETDTATPFTRCVKTEDCGKDVDLGAVTQTTSCPKTERRRRRALLGHEEDDGGRSHRVLAPGGDKYDTNDPYRVKAHSTFGACLDETKQGEEQYDNEKCASKEESCSTYTTAAGATETGCILSAYCGVTASILGKEPNRETKVIGDRVKYKCPAGIKKIVAATKAEKVDLFKNSIL